MVLQVGDFRLPTLGDAISGTEGMLGNVIEDVIQATTGHAVELTPGNGIDRTKVRGARGTGDIEFDRKVASHDEVEHMKREVKRMLADQAREIAKLKVIVRSQMQQAQRPQQSTLTWVPQAGSYAAPPQQSQPMNPMLLLALLMGEQGGNTNFTTNPLMMFALMQMLQQAPVASVGGQPVNIDLTTVMMVSQLMGLFRPATGKLVKN